jgi:hypothetical protein
MITSRRADGWLSSSWLTLPFSCKATGAISRSGNLRGEIEGQSRIPISAAPVRHQTNRHTCTWRSPLALLTTTVASPIARANPKPCASILLSADGTLPRVASRTSIGLTLHRGRNHLRESRFSRRRVDPPGHRGSRFRSEIPLAPWAWTCPLRFLRPSMSSTCSWHGRRSDAAHSAYNALIRRLVSFERAAACAS